MLLKNANKEQVEAIRNNIADKIIKQPIFMYYCPNVDKRLSFINAYLRYYIYELSEYDTLFCDENNNALLSLVNPRTFEYRFKGKGAMAMRKQKDNAKRIFAHRKSVRNTVHIIAPGTVSPRVMTIYGNAETDMPAIKSLISEAIDYADREKLTLVYETFSKKFIPVMEDYGFAIAYRKMYSDTKFIQTIMVKYPDRIVKGNKKADENETEYEQEEK